MLNDCAFVGGSSQSSSGAIRGVIVAKLIEIDENRKEDEDSAIGRSATTGSDEGSSKYQNTK